MHRMVAAAFIIGCVGLAIGSSNLVVDMRPFNYSDGAGSAEANSFQRRQGGLSGQSHFTFDATDGVSAYYVFLFPDLPDAKERLQKWVGGNDAARKNLGLDMPVAWDEGDQRPALREGTWARLHLKGPGKFIIEDIPAGGYYILPAVGFNAGCYAPGHWYPAFYDENVTVDGADLAPVLWCDKYVQLEEGDTTWIEINPQPFNIYWDSHYDIGRFTKAAIFGVSYDDLAK